MSLNPLEKKAALALLPYFSKEPVVFDVGSNKGFWSDILIGNVSEMHLFEPNRNLLIYTMVKYDGLTNVKYNDVAVFSESKEMDFFYFTNTNNGLSSVFDNPKWHNLPMKHGKCKSITLDEYWDKDIDFLKIDVEGADLHVLMGARNLLKNKRIKFIQVESSEHLALAGHTFQMIVDFVTPFGYNAFDFTGLEFVRATEFTQENYYLILDKDFTQDWNGEFKKNVALIPKQFKSTVDYKNYHFNFVLEIGCFEGLTTNYICDNLLAPDGRIVCVDPLTDEYMPDHPDNDLFKGQYSRFIRNTKGRPVELIRKKSIDAYEQLKDYRFNFIYIDGDHTEEAVFNDGVMCWNLLLDTRGNGGYMLFDDYGQSEATARGIERFLETQKGNYKLLVKDYQVLIQRLC